MWIARNKNNILYLFKNKPILDLCTKEYFINECLMEIGVYDEEIKDNIDLFKEVTFENSPIELNLKTKK